MTEGADLVLTGGTVWTGCPGRPFAEAVAIGGTKVVAVGPAALVRSQVGRAAEVVELAGKAVLPGFQDAHCHPVSGGMQARSCDMGEARTLDDCQAAVSRFLASHPGAPWVTGKGWSMETFPGGTPPASALDQVSEGRPVFVVNRDGHSAWVNSRALELAGIDSSTPDPPDGRIERDESGRPQGTLHEGAMELVRRLVPKPTTAELAAALEDAQAHLLALGVTAWQDAMVDPQVQGAYEAIAALGKLKARVRLALWWERGRSLEQVADLVARRERLAERGLCAGTVKVMLDGVMETYTAALLEPYTVPGGGNGDASERSASRPGPPMRDLGSGKLFFEPELVKSAVSALSREGFQVHFHAIGDRAVRLALDAVEASKGSLGALQGAPAEPGAELDPRHHIAHIQLVHPDDLGRFHSLGVVANMQPFWACREPQMTELTLPFLGPVRSSWQYPFASLVDRGAVLAGGSDWPVSTANPLEEVAVAVARVLPEAARRGAPPEEPLLPEERLCLPGALTAFTAGSAFVNHLEGSTGTIEVGKQADLVVLEQDPFTVGADHLPEARVCLTMIGGEVVFDSGRA